MTEYKTTNIDTFQDLVSEIMDHEQQLLRQKGREYASQEDRLKNFRQQAYIQGTTMEQIALTFLLKHILAIAEAVNKREYAWCWEGKNGEGLKQRFADARNYLLLLAACIDEYDKDNIKKEGE